MFGMSRRERRLLKRYEHAVSQMEPQERTVFLAARVDDVPFDQLGSHCDMTQAQAEEALCRSLAVLAKYVGEEDIL